jgi:hypothetical protein
MEEQPEHILTTRHTTETKWYCVDKERCAELDEMIASATHHFNSLSANVADKYITGLECLQREAKLQLILKELRAERASLWRRGKKEIEETIDEATGAIVATNRKVVLPHRVQEGPAIPQASLEGDPLVRIRHV